MKGILFVNASLIVQVCNPELHHARTESTTTSYQPCEHENAFWKIQG